MLTATISRSVGECDVSFVPIAAGQYSPKQPFNIRHQELLVSSACEQSVLTERLAY